MSGLNNSLPQALGGNKKITRKEVEKILDKGLENLNESELLICEFEVQVALFNYREGTAGWNKLYPLLCKIQALIKEKDEAKRAIAISLF